MMETRTMAMQPCRDCGEPVSSRAYRCPHCTGITGLGALEIGVTKWLPLYVLAMIVWKMI
jgi:ribosomal protein L40E